MPRIPVNNYANHFDPAKAHHRAFFQALLDRVDKLDPKALQDGGDLRDLWVAAVETKAPAVQQPAWLPAALKIIREFEGCRLKAYKCPSGVWTIGWGSTRLPGSGAVRPGDEITQENADRQLAAEVVGLFGPGVAALVKPWARLAPNAQAALVSFAYNVGLGAFEGSTLLRRLNAGYDPNAVAREELPRWVKGENGKQLDGLVRRRAAEVALFVSGGTPPAAAPVPLQQRPNPLPVRYLSQRDSQASGQALRMCFSSSCAMLCAFLRPGSITGVNADDQYLATVRQFGDTTDANAQLRALAAYGIKARFVQTADWGDIERQIDRGVPVPCGFLHHGPVSKPSGGGHWLTVVGYTPSHVIVHDPFGEMDVVAGTYLNTKGAMVSYSRKNWGPRWMPEGSRSGWAIIAEP